MDKQQPTKNWLKKIFGIGDIGYLRKLWGGFAMAGGAYLIGEHIIVWGEFEFFDFIGHEWLGLVLLLGGLFGGFATFGNKEERKDNG